MSIHRKRIFCLITLLHIQTIPFYHVFPSGHRSNTSPLARMSRAQTPPGPLSQLPTYLSAKHRQIPRCALYLTTNTFPLGRSQLAWPLSSCNLWFVVQIIGYEEDLTGMQKIIDRVSSQKKTIDSSGTDSSVMGHQWDSLKWNGMSWVRDKAGHLSNCSEICRPTIPTQEIKRNII